MRDPAFRTATELTAALREGELGSLELLELHLERVERLNPAINAVVALDAEGARARAREADAARARGDSWGPLHGLPMSIKDSLEVVGMPCTSGAPELRDHRPARHADTVQRLVDAGAVVFGKTNLPIWAGDFQSYNEVYGTTNNPWDPSRVPGGSSGGSAAALAAGLTPLEVGSDIGGSIRNPAHFCGVFGHKPSWGAVSGRGHVPGPPGQLSRPDIAVVGPMARCAEDLALAMELLAGPDAWDAAAWRLELPPPRHRSLSEYRVAAWLDDPICPVSTEVGDRLQATVDALARAGARIDAKARPPVDPAEGLSVYLRLLYGVTGAGFPAPIIEAFDQQLEKLDPADTGMMAEMVRGTSGRHRDWNRTNEHRQHLRARWAEYFRDVDVLLCPIMPTVAFPHDQSEISARSLEVDGAARPYLEQVFWAGFIGAVLLPATAVPVGVGPSGLPIGLQVVGPFLGDRTTIDFARHMEDALGGFTAPPGYE